MSRSNKRSHNDDDREIHASFRPRNPYALPARQRRAGAHQADHGSQRSASKTMTQRLLNQAMDDIDFDDKDEY